MIAADTIRALDWDDIAMRINACRESDVLQALYSDAHPLQRFISLISRPASAYLEAIAQQAWQVTRQRFGNTVSLFAPLYLSNLCANECTYCGFSMHNRIRRTTLGPKELMQEIGVLKARQIDHVLLVTGEHERHVGLPYFKEMLPLISPHFRQISMEVQPLNCQEYRALRDNGVSGVLVYQETYHRHNYARYHRHGRKQDFDWRLETPDRLGKAGMARIGLGALLGLSDWRTDSVFTAAHSLAIQKHYWRSRISISVPRLKPCAGQTDTTVYSSPGDAELLQLICAFRLIMPSAEISLSTREPSHLRDHLAGLGVTTMSADSKTEPGGYANAGEALAQFSTDDNRSVGAVSDALRHKGLEPVMTDGLQVFT